MPKTKHLWMAVTADEYETPLAVTETANELGTMIGANPGTIRSEAYNEKVTGKYSKVRYVKVVYE